LPYPNDRRKHRPEGDEVLSPEYLAMLIASGGEVRASDRDAARERPRNYGRRKDDLPLAEQDWRRPPG
jgi:hypothetical protein